MLNRDKNGELVLNSLDLEIFMKHLFYKCDTKKEIEWLKSQIASCNKVMAEERLEEL